VTALRADVAPTAAAVARLAAPRCARGEGADAASAAPLYVRDKVAFTTAERLARGGSK
jgi:tRNA threonylcarbamoyladenosine biosynthesis protein TsaB